MIKAENGMVMINVENHVNLMADFVTVVKAVHATVKQTETEQEATKIVLGAVDVALEKEIDRLDEELDEDLEQEDETPVATVEIKLPEELNGTIDKVIKNIFGEDFLNEIKEKEGEK